MKLIILGNGFDLANDLPTKYSDFFGYLVKKKEDEFKEVIEFIENENILSTSKENCHEYYRHKKEDINSLNGINPKTKAFKALDESVSEDRRNVIDTYKEFVSKNINSKFNFWIFFFWYKYMKKNNGNKDWFEIELEIKDFLISIKDNKSNLSFLFQEAKNILDLDNLWYDEDSDFSNVLSRIDKNRKIDAILNIFFNNIKLNHNGDIYTGIYNELLKFENEFRNYINEILDVYIHSDTNNLRIYRDNFLELINHDKIHNEYSVLNFNYTSFSNNFSHNKTMESEFTRNNQKITIFETNIHGNYNSISIFGIDQKDIEPTTPLYQFTKTYRKMIEQEKISNFTLPYKGEIDEIIFYGHSLSDADYSYFQSIFDYYDIYQSNIRLTFLYSEYGEKDNYLTLRKKQISNVTNLLNKYGVTIGNNDRGKNLVHKLLLENRLGFKIIKLKKLQTSELYFDLLDYRTTISGIEKVSADKVLSYEVVTSIVKNKPVNTSELLKIKGFSSIKNIKYGEDIIEIVKKHIN